MREWALQALLDLDGTIIEQVKGCWVKFEVKLVEKTPTIPHGIRYSLTLHDKHGGRILGYDNAHAIKTTKKSRYVAKRTAYDHRHQDKDDKGTCYEFSSPEQLVQDFWIDVDKNLKKMM